MSVAFHTKAVVLTMCIVAQLLQHTGTFGKLTCHVLWIMFISQNLLHVCNMYMNQFVLSALILFT